MKGRKRQDPLTRFFSHVKEIDSGCLIWTGPKLKGGYGQFGVAIDGTWVTVLSHRWIYEAKVGPIPEGLVIDHLCRVRDCVNYKHLEAVTNKTNLLRGNTIPGINARKTHCKYGHPFDEENTRLIKGQYGCLIRFCLKCHEGKRPRVIAQLVPPIENEGWPYIERRRQQA
jgi:hypothetical protein